MANLKTRGLRTTADGREGRAMTEEIREFDLADVLTITTGKMVSPRGVEAIYDILDYMTGDDLFYHQLPRAGQRCKPVLLRQHPRLRAHHIHNEVDKLRRMMRRVGPDDRKNLLAGWVYRLKGTYGNSLWVRPIADWEREDPIEELKRLVGPFGEDKLIVIRPGVA